MDQNNIVELGIPIVYKYIIWIKTTGMTKNGKNRDLAENVIHT